MTDFKRESYMRAPDDGSRIHVYSDEGRLTVLRIYKTGHRPAYVTFAIDPPTLARKRREWRRQNFVPISEAA